MTTARANTDVSAPTGQAEVTRMEERLRKLAREKSYLQLVNNLMERLSAVPGLDNTIDTLLRLVIDNIGGSNAIVYYLVEGRLHSVDAFGLQQQDAAVTDPLVRQVLASREVAEESRPHGDTRLTVPVAAKTGNWAFPLQVGGGLVGVLKVENAPISPEVGERLLPFMHYAALVLKNEIENYARLQEAYEEVNTAKEALQAHAIALAERNEELRLAYRELKDAQAQLLQREKMASIGQLAAGVAHEINTPMGFILSNLGTLKRYAAGLAEFLALQSAALTAADGGKDAADLSAPALAAKRKALKIDRILDDIGQLVDESVEGGLRVKDIVQNLKSFSRIDEVEQAESDLNAGIEDTLAILGNALKSKATVSRDYGDLPLLFCNIGQLNQVFMNLLLNAVHAIDSQGEIRIRTRCDDGKAITVSISDTGYGMTPEVANRIFEPFFTTKAVGQGTGLGLAICYDIVKKHHGEIFVASRPGAGTTFTIRLPLTEAKAG